MKQQEAFKQQETFGKQAALRKPGKISAASLLIGALMCILSASCLLPLINVLAESFSSNASVMAGDVWFWPVGFTLQSYIYVLNRPQFWQSMSVSLQRVALGGVVNVALCLLTAYPLSKPQTRFRFRTAYAWFFFFTTLFSGGLIPWYIVIKELHLLDSIWALVLPGSVSVFNILLMLNFYRSIPTEMEEAAIIDGAGQWRILFQLYVPVSMSAVATIALFTLVGHWNSWFDGIVLMNSPSKYPMSSYLRILLFQSGVLEARTAAEREQLKEISERTLQAAQMFVGIVPIMIVYPFMQKYFVKGIMLGSVKG